MQMSHQFAIKEYLIEKRVDICMLKTQEFERT